MKKSIHRDIKYNDSLNAAILFSSFNYFPTSISLMSNFSLLIYSNFLSFLVVKATAKINCTLGIIK